MRIAYLDCFAGISGDMLLGALVGAGVPVSVLEEAASALKIGASLRLETVDRSGISATKVYVLEGGELAEARDGEGVQAAGDGVEGEALEQKESIAAAYTAQPKTQHLHKTGHPHTHEHESSPAKGASHEHSNAAHSHGRSLEEIRRLIEAAPLADAVKSTALRAFELLGYSEAKIHNVPVEQIHFHEVGAVDAIVDIVAASAGLHHLAVDAWYCSEINVGGGMVDCAHGRFPVPAPATADLLRGMPTYSAHLQKELVTPTGAALLRALTPTFGRQPAMRVERIGYGAGTRNPEGFPNVLRLSVGVATEELRGVGSSSIEIKDMSHTGERTTETVAILETALDDLSPQVIAYAAEQALAHGALDVMLTPVVMKKGRAGTLMTVLCRPEENAALEQLLLRETSTLGVRVRHEQRISLERSELPVETAFGVIRVKVGREGDAVRNAAPEFEDCRAAASRHGVALKQVQQAAMAAYLATR